MKTRPPTAEQLPIIRSRLDTLLVQAFAGAGKTATLEFLAGANLGLRMLPLTFTNVLQVTQSYLFGQGIAGLATLILAGLKGETQALIGSGKHQSQFIVHRNLPHAVISPS